MKASIREGQSILYVFTCETKESDRIKRIAWLRGAKLISSVIVFPEGEYKRRFLELTIECSLEQLLTIIDRIK